MREAIRHMIAPSTLAEGALAATFVGCVALLLIGFGG